MAGPATWTRGHVLDITASQAQFPHECRVERWLRVTSRDLVEGVASQRWAQWLVQLATSASDLLSGRWNVVGPRRLPRDPTTADRPTSADCLPHHQPAGQGLPIHPRGIAARRRLFSAVVLLSLKCAFNNEFKYIVLQEEHTLGPYGRKSATNCLVLRSSASAERRRRRHPRMFSATLALRCASAECKTRISADIETDMSCVLYSYTGLYSLVLFC